MENTFVKMCCDGVFLKSKLNDFKIYFNSKYYSLRLFKFNKNEYILKLPHGHYKNDIDVIGNLKNETIILRNLNHENIVVYKTFALVNSTRCLVVEKFGNKTLDDLIRFNKDIKIDLFNLALNLINGLNYLHSNGIIHLDLKPANILLDTITQQIKICDFGLSVYEKEKIERDNKLLTTTYILPPESKFPGFTIITKSIDIWAYGCCLYFFIERCYYYLYKVFKDQSHLNNITKYFISKKLNNENELILNILLNCLRINPSERFTCKQILNLLKQN